MSDTELKALKAEIARLQRIFALELRRRKKERRK